ncbi:outer membrane beta-barrel family protein [Rufibacter roseus]|uniref:Outer membrane beta-barrel protein n=1 Tax=Rufibacter roseus TaxID=1567108 RepID=A0ABW2DSY2_9BACT|nr:outer membrane beta-barrel family protein [Rufibacter roseus]
MKKMNHFLLFLIAMGCMIQASFGQTAGSLTGLVVDDKGEPLSYGTVTLHKAPDASLVTGEAIDVQGNFKMKAPASGKYFLRISAMGFANQDLPVFEVTTASFSKDFGKIALKQDSEVLQEVTVEGMRPMIDHQADKMVVNVEGTAMAAGNTAYDVLTKMPGVWVDQDGNIQLNGQQGARVMINGKLTYLDGKQLQTMLQSMPAENLKNFEIITNPSAKHDAEGTAGIININLKKNQLDGLNGSVYGGYQFNKEHGYNGGASINLKQGKWSSFATADLSQRPRMREFTMNRNFAKAESDKQMLLTGGEDGMQYSQSIRIGTDYDFNSNHSLGGSVSLARSTTDNLFFTTTTSNLQSSTGPEVNRSVNNNDSKFANATANLHYQGKLDSLGTSLSADVDVVRITDKSFGTFRLTPEGANNSNAGYLLENDNPTSYSIYSAKVDFVRPLPQLKGKFEGGLKGSYVRSDNAINFFEINDIQRTPIANRTDHFIYDENIYAAYANFNTALGSKWSLQTGLRSEYTRSKGHSVPTKATNRREYLDFFPSIFLSQQVSENYQISYNYSRRINRPRYNNLNPFTLIIDNGTEATGNPHLKPQYTNSFQMTQTFKKSYNLVLGYSQSKDAMSEVPVPNLETKKITFQQRNVESEFMNATLVTPVTVSSKWNFNNNITLAYQKYTTVLPDITINNEQVSVFAQTNHNVMLPNKFRLEVSGGYQGAGVFNVYRTLPSYWVDLGVKKSFLKDQLDVTLTATDLFASRKMRGTSTVDGTTNEIDMYHYNRGIRLNLRYRFNKGEKFEMKRRNNSLEEVNRAGGN